MLTVTRYINGIKIEDEDMKNYTLESEVITRTILAVNKRLGLDDPLQSEARPQST